MIDFDTTREEHELICEIIKRAFAINPNLGDFTERAMDITACHLNGCPLDLEALVKADDFNLIHDVVGITNHINRETGKLTRGFLPRMCKRGVE